MKLLLKFIDRWQQKHHALAFPYAVLKKYGDDEAGSQAALITYYGFLALFPLILVATSVVDMVAQHNKELHTRLLADINTYFPIVGNQLQAQVHNNKTGVALALGLLFALYGARGAATAVRGALDHAWATPKVQRSGFPLNLIKSLGILFGAGLGLLGTATLASYATAELGRSFAYRLVPLAINLLLLYVIFMYIFVIGTSRNHPRKDLRLGAITATIGLLILQTVGGYLITHQLHNLSGLYGQFALVLAILFWIYLQAQVLTYAIEINVVHAYKLWPRSLAGGITEADKKAYRLYAKKEAYRPTPEEEIDVIFHSKA